MPVYKKSYGQSYLPNTVWRFCVDSRLAVACTSLFETKLGYIIYIIIIGSFISYCYLPGPEKFDDKLPSYPGFEKDVFRVVKDYFYAQQEPLLTYDLFEVITNVFSKCFDM